MPQPGQGAPLSQPKQAPACWEQSGHVHVPSRDTEPSTCSYNYHHPWADSSRAHLFLCKSGTAEAQGLGRSARCCLGDAGQAGWSQCSGESPPRTPAP